MSRRIFKKVYESNTMTSHERYLYDGFKQIAAYNVKNTCTQIASYLWRPFVGEDVPLIMKQGTNRYFYLTDGKKNITGLFDASGTRAAMYLYGPFGQLLSSSGTIANVNPFRFSSEVYDPSIMKNPDGRRKNLFREGSFLLALFLFQTCLDRIDSMGVPMESMQLQEIGTKVGQMSATVSGHGIWRLQKLH